MQNRDLENDSKKNKNKLDLGVLGVDLGASKFYFLHSLGSLLEDEIGRRFASVSH